MMRSSTAATLAVALLLASPSRAAETNENAPQNGTHAVTLHELLVEALSSNLELTAKRIDPKIQQDRLRGAQGAFMPNFVAGYSWLSSERPKTVQENSSVGAIFGGKNEPILREDTVRGQVGLNGRLPFGTQFEALTGIDRLR